VLFAEPPAECGGLVQRALRLSAVDVDPDAGSAAGTQRGDHDQAGALDDRLGEHLLVLAVSPAAVLVVRQEPAGGDGLRVGGAEGWHVWSGDQWLQPLPRDCHGRHDTRAVGLPPDSAAVWPMHGWGLRIGEALAVNLTAPARPSTTPNTSAANRPGTPGAEVTRRHR
jgi:hypothetical protein